MNIAARSLLAVHGLFLSAFSAFAFTAAAGDGRLPAGLIDALSPVEGYVIESRVDGFLVDLGRRDGIVAGDLLAVLGKAKSFAHPVTGEAVQGLPGIESVLRVTRVEETVALARAAAPGVSPPRVGAPITRYEGLKARFVDHTGSGESLYMALREALPHLEWQGYAGAARGKGTGSSESDPVSVVFELSADRLVVRGAGAEPIRSYAFAAREPAARPQKAQRASVDPAVAAPSAAYRAEYSRAEPVVSLPGGVRIADFLHRDGRLLMASTDGYRIRVHTIAGDRSVAESITTDAAAGEVMSVHWWQPDGIDKAYLATTSFDGERASGALYDLRGERLVAVTRRVPYILATFDTDGDGRRETLLGQTYERTVFFGPRVHRLTLSSEGLLKRGADVPFPKRFTVQGAAFADLTGDGRSELAFVRDRMLHIYSSSGELLYRSPRQIGGSLSWVHYELDPELEFSPVNTVPFEISPVAVDLDGDGVRELVAVAADLSLLSLTGAGPSVKRSWLAIFQYRDGQIIKGKLGPERDFPVQGLTAAEDAILMVTPTSTSIMGHTKESQIIAVRVKD